MTAATKHRPVRASENSMDNAIEQAPPDWPSNITYLSSHTYTAAVSDEQRIALSRPAPDAEQWSRISKTQLNTTHDRVAITAISDEKHPAFGQHGLFARHTLPPDTFITTYLGIVHINSLSDTDPHSDYDLSLDREIGLSVDAAKAGNHARFTNDYRGIAERPNAEFRDCFVQVPCSKRSSGLKWERRVGIFVLPTGKAGKRKAGIRQGEEVLVSYGKSYWESRKLLASFRKDDDMLKAAEAALEHD